MKKELICPNCQGNMPNKNFRRNYGCKWCVPEKIMRAHILLIHYKYDPIAWLIRIFTNSYWNHTAWFYDTRYIIEVKKNGVRIDWYFEYSNNKLYDTQLLRIKDLTKKDNDRILHYLLNTKPKFNFFSRLFSYILIGLKYNKSFITATCSGFIAQALATCNIYFIPNKKTKFITPEDIYQSDITEKV